MRFCTAKVGTQCVAHLRGLAGTNFTRNRAWDRTRSRPSRGGTRKPKESCSAGPWALPITSTAWPTGNRESGVTAWHGRPAECGLAPIRGHSNVQGMGSVGVTPQLKQSGVRSPAEPFRRAAADRGRARHHGLRRGGRCRAAQMRFLPGGISMARIPMPRLPPRPSGKLDLFVYLNTTLNSGHAHGLAKETIVLPVFAQ